MTSQLRTYEVLVLAYGVKASECRMLLKARDQNHLAERLKAELPKGCVVIGTPSPVRRDEVMSPA